MPRPERRAAAGGAAAAAGAAGAATVQRSPCGVKLTRPRAPASTSTTSRTLSGWAPARSVEKGPEGARRTEVASFTPVTSSASRLGSGEAEKLVAAHLAVEGELQGVALARDRGEAVGRGLHRAGLAGHR